MRGKRIVIVGGALAGPAAAARAREFDESADIVLLQRGARINYALCALNTVLSGTVRSVEDLNRQQAEYFSSIYRVTVRTNVDVRSIDPRAKTVSIMVAGRDETVPYDSLVYCPGAESLLPENAPHQASNLFVFRTIDDLASIKNLLDRGRKRVLILGGGPMSFDAAHGLLAAGASVTVVERERRLLEGFRAGTASRAHEALASRAMVHLGVSVESYGVHDGAIVDATLTDGRRIETDIVISAIGVAPRTRLLREAGATLGPAGTVLVDQSCRTSLPDVFGCGSCVSAPHPLTELPTWIPQASFVDRTAQVAGANAAGGTLSLGNAVGSYLVRLGDSYFGRVGLGFDAARNHFGAEQIRVTDVEVSDRESFVNGASEIVMALMWHAEDGRVLGAEASGGPSIIRELDSALAAIAGRMTVTDLASLDFTYHPELTSIRPPVTAAATIARLEYLGIGHSVSPEDLAARVPTAKLISVGSEDGSGGVGIPGSIDVPFDALRGEKLPFDGGAPLIMVSEYGKLGWLAARVLRGRSFSDVSFLSGGLRAWRRTRSE